MVYCHKKRIVHRDLKLDNILFSTHPNLETSTLKIIDFGASALMTADATLKKRIGTVRVINYLSQVM
jgi:serine/threonine protein kinase